MDTKHPFSGSVAWPLRPQMTGKILLENMLARPDRVQLSDAPKACLVVALPEDARLVAKGLENASMDTVVQQMSAAVNEMFYQDTAVANVGHLGVLLRLMDADRQVVVIELPFPLIHDLAAQTMTTGTPEEVVRHWLSTPVGVEGEPLFHFVSRSALAEVIPATWMFAGSRCDDSNFDRLFERSLTTDGLSGFLRVEIEAWGGDRSAGFSSAAFAADDPVPGRLLATSTFKQRSRPAPR